MVLKPFEAELDGDGSLLPHALKPWGEAPTSTDIRLRLRWGAVEHRLGLSHIHIPVFLARLEGRGRLCRRFASLR